MFVAMCGHINGPNTAPPPILDTRQPADRLETSWSVCKLGDPHVVNKHPWWCYTSLHHPMYRSLFGSTYSLFAAIQCVSPCMQKLKPAHAQVHSHTCTLNAAGPAEPATIHVLSKLQRLVHHWFCCHGTIRRHLSRASQGALSSQLRSLWQ
jgi:hypothetical protein